MRCHPAIGQRCRRDRTACWRSVLTLRRCWKMVVANPVMKSQSSSGVLGSRCLCSCSCQWPRSTTETRPSVRAGLFPKGQLLRRPLIPADLRVRPGRPLVAWSWPTPVPTIVFFRCPSCGVSRTYYEFVEIDFGQGVVIKTYAGFTVGLESIGWGLLGQAGFFDQSTRFPRPLSPRGRPGRGKESGTNDIMLT
jgi:hypothetical protein